MTEFQIEAINKAIRILQDAGLNMVSEEDVLIEDKNGKLFLAGQELTANNEQTLKQEANMIMGTSFYKLFLASVRNAAISRIAFNSKNWEDIFMGKAILLEDAIFRSMMLKLANRETKIDKITKKG